MPALGHEHIWLDESARFGHVAKVAVTPPISVQGLNDTPEQKPSQQQQAAAVDFAPKPLIGVEVANVTITVHVIT